MSESYSEAEIERSQRLIAEVLGLEDVIKLDLEAQEITNKGRTITNVLGLPEAIVRAVTRDTYSKGRAEFSATELLLPPRVRALRRRHRNEIVEDVSDVIYRLVGQIGHLVLERAGKGSKDIVEKRFFASVADHIISGQSDLVLAGDHWVGYDYKFTSIWTVKEGPKPEWIAQLNILRLLAWLDKKIAIPELINVAIYRDWSKREARREAKRAADRGEKITYPQHPAGIFPVPVWSYQETEAFVRSRIALHLAAEKFLPDCTPEERWAKPDQWKVKKTFDAKRAVKGGVFDDQLEANKFAAKHGWHVVYTPAESIRCEDYCDVADFCSQFAVIQQADNPDVPF